MVWIKGTGVLAGGAEWQPGGERGPPPPEQEAAAGTGEKTEEVRNNVDISRQRGIHHNVDPTVRHIFPTVWADVPGAVVKTKAERAVFVHGENEGAEGLRYALLTGLSVPQRADWAAAPEGGIPETQAGRLHQPLQEGYARTFRLCQRHWVLQQRRGMAGVW